MRRISALCVLVFALTTGCNDDPVFSSTTQTVAPESTATTTTSLLATTTTTLATTTTPFTAPPATLTDPELTEFAGLWRWSGTHTRYLQLQDHGAIATGNVVDHTLRLDRVGQWTVSDGLTEVRFLSAGGVCANEAVGYYELSRSGNNLVMSAIADECSTRARWLIGADRTTRTWIPVTP